MALLVSWFAHAMLNRLLLRCSSLCESRVSCGFVRCFLGQYHNETACCGKGPFRMVLGVKSRVLSATFASRRAAVVFSLGECSPFHWYGVNGCVSQTRCLPPVCDGIRRWCSARVCPRHPWRHDHGPLRYGCVLSPGRLQTERRRHVRRIPMRTARGLGEELLRDKNRQGKQQVL